MTALMDAARAKGLKVMAGEVLKTNTNMLKLMNRLGFSIEDRLDDDNIKRVRKIL